MQNILSLNNFNLSYAGYDLILGSSGPVPPIDPYNPLNLPPYTLRVVYKDGVIPIVPANQSRYTVERVSYYPNVWDIYHPVNDWGEWGGYPLLPDTDNFDLYPRRIIEILGANTTNVTNLDRAFENCSALSSISLFDTRNVTSMSATFNNCQALPSIPLYDTYNVVNFDKIFYQCYNLSSVPLFNTHNVSSMYQSFWDSHISAIPAFDMTNITNMNYTFFDCAYVESGLSAMYQSVSGKITDVNKHWQTFSYCGRLTEQGNAERALIPTSWGGSMS